MANARQIVIEIGGNLGRIILVAMAIFSVWLFGGC